jgi:hypothetical protein
MEQLMKDDETYDDEQVWVNDDLSFIVGGVKWIAS